MSQYFSAGMAALPISDGTISVSTHFSGGQSILRHAYFEKISEFDTGTFVDVGSSSVDVISYMKPDPLLNLSTISSDSNFDAENKWYIVMINYKHPTTGQHKVLTHLYDGADWKGYTTFDPSSNDGIWQKDRVILIDTVGDTLAIKRDEIGVDEDIDIVSNN